jgi:hypothetical protein
VTRSFDKSIDSAPHALDLTSDSQVNKRPCVRLYTSAPGEVTLQLRSLGSTRQTRGGAHKHIVASAGLTVKTARELMNALQFFVTTEEGKVK